MNVVICSMSDSTATGSPGGSPRDTLDLIDAVFDEVHGPTHLDLVGVLVHLVERTASAPMGRDQSGRYEHADTYQLIALRPSHSTFLDEPLSCVYGHATGFGICHPVARGSSGSIISVASTVSRLAIAGSASVAGMS